MNSMLMEDFNNKRGNPIQRKVKSIKATDNLVENMPNTSDSPQFPFNINTNTNIIFTRIFIFIPFNIFFKVSTINQYF
eukprot:gnl/Chilomastix_caulleri/4447.p2 GENE.gnl/Chilomastix_caulleri/4447~~gnl/Chilomastix_caulleri/4447.p2  ORF type:complete len:78 (-),score=17.73 gnl/Chilomastix_caulleri/4447:233-466(-)